MAGISAITVTLQQQGRSGKWQRLGQLEGEKWERAPETQRFPNTYQSQEKAEQVG